MAPRRPNASHAADNPSSCAATQIRDDGKLHLLSLDVGSLTALPTIVTDDDDEDEDGDLGGAAGDALGGESDEEAGDGHPPSRRGAMIACARWWDNTTLAVSRRDGSVLLPALPTMRNRLGDVPEHFAAAPALSTGAEDRGRDIALLRFVQARISMPAEQRNGPVEEKWQACLRVQSAVVSRRRALALMYVLCAKDPPRAELGDDSGRLSVAVRLAKKGKNDIVEMIIDKFGAEGARELDRAVTELLA